jgi:hypothetical protein
MAASMTESERRKLISTYEFGLNGSLNRRNTNHEEMSGATGAWALPGKLVKRDFLLSALCSRPPPR